MRGRGLPPGYRTTIEDDPQTICPLTLWFRERGSATLVGTYPANIKPWCLRVMALEHVKLRAIDRVEEEYLGEKEDTRNM